MRDMGRAVTSAIDEVMETRGLKIAVFACHQLFLADIGIDLLEPSQAALRALFRRTKIRPKLRDLARDLGWKIGDGIEASRQAVLNWPSLAETGNRIPPGTESLAIVRAMTQ